MTDHQADPRSAGAQGRGGGAWRPVRFLIAPFLTLHRHWWLVLRLTRREIEVRFRGSLLGVVWTVLPPLLMLAVYTFVFSTVFRGRWSGSGDEPRATFALLLFSGMIVFSIFAEAMNRAPSLMLENVSYIKKVVFPLDALAWVVLLGSLFTAAVSFVIWVVFYAVAIGSPPWTALLLPVVLLPLCLLSLGVIWLLASLGVFLRDIRQLTGVVTTALMFLSPVFFPRSAVPPRFQALMDLNPLTTVLEQSKEVLVFGLPPDWGRWGALLAASWLACGLGHAWFQRTRKAFPDVI